MVPFNHFNVFMRNLYGKNTQQNISFTPLSQPAFTCSKSTIETPELCVKSVQSYKEKHQNDITHPEVF